MPRTPRLSLYLLAAAQRDLLGSSRTSDRLPLALPDASDTVDDCHPSTSDLDTLWIHVAPSTAGPAAVALIQRLQAERPELRIVATTDASLLVPGATVVPRPPEAASQIRRFLERWDPAVALWLGEPVWPVLATEAHRRDVKAILADISAARSGPFGTGPEHVVKLFRHVLARSITDAEILRRACRRPSHVEASAPLREGPAPRPCDPQELDALTEINAGRPVWLAQGVEANEIEDVLAAHVRASRVSHRLLLVLAPAAGADTAGLAASLSERGWSVERRSCHDAPSPGTQIFLVDVEDEEALWFRVAPITFLGRSLHEPGGALDPAEPAALGSAIVHGPWVGSHKNAYRRLDGAGAALRIETAEDLGRAVADLQSPERAAQMANAAWRLASEGAEVTDRILTLVLELLDQAA